MEAARRRRFSLFGIGFTTVSCSALCDRVRGKTDRPLDGVEVACFWAACAATAPGLY